MFFFLMEGGVGILQGNSEKCVITGIFLGDL